jgi:hypothetical protein
MISTIRKIVAVIAALALGGAFGYVTSSLIGEESLVTAVKYAVLTGIVVVLADAGRRAWRWWRALQGG